MTVLGLAFGYLSRAFDVSFVYMYTDMYTDSTRMSLFICRCSVAHSRAPFSCRQQAQDPRTLVCVHAHKEDPCCMHPSHMHPKAKVL